MVGDGAAQVGLELLVDVLQGRGDGDTLLHGKGQPVGLTGAVIGVLAQDDDLHLVIVGEAEGVEQVLPRGIDGTGGIFRVEKGAESLGVFVLQHRAEKFGPSGRQGLHGRALPSFVFFSIAQGGSDEKGFAAERKKERDFLHGSMEFPERICYNNKIIKIRHTRTLRGGQEYGIFG